VKETLLSDVEMTFQGPERIFGHIADRALALHHRLRLVDNVAALEGNFEDFGERIGPKANTYNKGYLQGEVN
jgi:hypothetical protein